MSGLLRHALLIPALVALAAPGLRALDLRDYKETRQLLVGIVSAQVTPAHSLRVKSPSDGRLFLRLPGNRGTILPAGTVWAEFDPERTALEREAITLARTLLEKKERPRLQLDTDREALDLADKRAETARQLRMFQRILDDPELAGFYLESPDAGDDRAQLGQTMERLRRQLDLMDAVLAYAGTEQHIEAESRVLDIKLRQHELDLKQREEDKRLAMPFDGEITLLIERPADDDTPVRTQLGDELALIQDYSAVRARFVVKRPELRAIAPETLHLRVSAGAVPLTAAFESRLIEETGGREELVYRFRFQDKDRATARPLAGGSLTARLYANLPQPARIIPKLDLVLAEPEAFREGDWHVGLAAALPGATLLAIGETELAVVPPAAR